MDREPWGVYPQFDELAGPDMPLDDWWWDMEVLWVLGVHGNTVHQLVLVGELLVVELLLQVVHSIFVKTASQIVGSSGVVHSTRCFL